MHQALLQQHISSSFETVLPVGTPKIFSFPSAQQPGVRSTPGVTLPLVAHALEQQRRFEGVEAAARRAPAGARALAGGGIVAWNVSM